VRKVNEKIPPESDENSSIKRLELMIDRCCKNKQRTQDVARSGPFFEVVDEVV
jgi:hypothetical protein